MKYTIENITTDDTGVPLDLMGDVQYALMWFVAIFVLDFILVRIKWFPEKNSATRYFSLHVIINAYVVFEHLPDIIATYSDPSVAFLGPCNTRGVMAIYALHLYHIAFYQPLDFIDWVHHVVMVVVMLPIAYLLAPGHLLGHGAFYASGLPGGLDYMMLVMIKLGWISKLDEKYYNNYIQLWVRAPGCLVHAWLTYHNYVEAVKRYEDPTIPDRLEYSARPLVEPHIARYAVWVVIITFYWNGQFFLERVIRSHERHIVKAAIEGKKAKAQ
ncbi:uncharacterized protein MONBRDRAFT_8601 [Monosiga brevicollis MX1]|uniref:TLC domain-containing protein n=1 Tax=Monosiga brevicollis TaxID=81824 RepID=A9V0J2_MONBE|nr:uncharacterized protein MONBRDRAFT_8601 [Monosiga brevicollis MX1]EDQ89161.1 predicted protein [Monosiga brevicollis MX1]|eukprot:XP_001746266.1 hypothetical protein [Monosiga brevicollis MX1]